MIIVPGTLAVVAMATARPVPGVPAAMSLSRNLVLSRAKASDLDTVRKLNCWGSNLKDLSVLRDMPNIEVITLSVNNISSLVDFQYCQNISELYLRKNNIQNLTEICYLKGLHRLRVLWLSENPCCGTDLHKYRMTVIRNLPQLQKLDNQAVTEEELAQALEDGDEIASVSGKEPMESTISHSRRESGTSEPSTELESDLLSFRMEETKTWTPRSLHISMNHRIIHHGKHRSLKVAAHLDMVAKKPCGVSLREFVEGLCSTAMSKIREELGMKPLGRDKFSSSVVLKEINASNNSRRRTSNVLNAVLLLLKELDADGLEIVHRTAEHKLRTLHRKDAEQER